jgi:hypothetical protein
VRQSVRGVASAGMLGAANYVVQKVLKRFR